VRPAAGAQVDIDVGLRDYMLRIYNYMASGLALTGIVAYGFSQYLFANPALARSAGDVPDHAGAAGPW